MKDSTGPKIRHPSGAVYPNVIFMKEERDPSQLSNAAETLPEYSGISIIYE